MVSFALRFIMQRISTGESAATQWGTVHSLTSKKVVSIHSLLQEIIHYITPVNGYCLVLRTVTFKPILYLHRHVCCQFTMSTKRASAISMQGESQLCKIFEAIVRDDIVEFLESNKLIRDSQHGFRRGSSCLTNLLLFLDKILQSVDEGFCVDVVF